MLWRPGHSGFSEWRGAGEGVRGRAWGRGGRWGDGARRLGRYGRNPGGEPACGGLGGAQGGFQGNDGGLEGAVLAPGAVGRGEVGDVGRGLPDGSAKRAFERFLPY